ncbi:helix-turn-helix domain-containing protein [Rugamonas sp. FT82W]|uniref:Helix-turn-helix domain-containing protein n=1 Tax=Duganella vulcania TaxID=2692166 RepID=A0A845FWG7_9BURK|nr:helix-turn-helix domain-containing protein [Duganella vulcania]
MNKETGGVVKSADRVLDVLELLAESGRPLSHTEIANQLNIPKSSLTSLLRNLEARGYLRMVLGPNSYELGPSVLALARQARGGFDLKKTGSALIDRLTQTVNESSSLNVLNGDKIELLYGANSSHALVYTMRVGDRAPLHAVSSGKAILAALPPAERDALLAGLDLARVTPNTITSINRLQEELKQVERDGIAFSFEEYTLGIIGIGAAVRGADGRPVAAINLAVPSVRYNEHVKMELINALRTTVGAFEDSMRLAS